MATPMPGRREQILATAATLFARDGFHGVSVAELGRACGTSGPALYRHFGSKDALLAEMLVGSSDELLRGGRARVRAARSASAALEALIEWHVSFALANRALIVVQDRDWAALPDDAREHVRTVQRKYVELWARQLRHAQPRLRPVEARARAHAVFGLINSTPRSGLLPDSQMASTLSSMARAALAT